MKKIIVLLSLLISTMAFGLNIAGVELEETRVTNGKELKLNGAGMRKKTFLKLYVGSLYTETATSDAKKVVEGNEAVAIKLDITSKLITSEVLKTAVEEGFTNSINNLKLEGLEEKINEFTSVFQEEIQKGDTFVFEYDPSVGVNGYKNEKLLITTEGHDFKKALIGIWLGEVPADENLKKEMLKK